MAFKYNFDWDKVKSKAKEQKDEKPSRAKDDRFWRFDYDKSTKKGNAIVRFLPDQQGNPFKKFYQHAFWYPVPNKGRRFYLGNCPTTLGKSCPICEKNREYYNSAFDSDREIARDRKRKIHYVSNILVIKDQAHPENDGKAFLFDYGPQIYGKIEEVTFDEDDEDGLEESENFNPFHFSKGADFLLKARKKEGFDMVTYEYSKFKRPSPIFPEIAEDEEAWYQKIEKIMDNAYDLDEFVHPDRFPDDNETRSRLAPIFGKVPGSDVPEVSEEDDVPWSDDAKEGSEPEKSTNDNVENEEVEFESDDEFFDSLINDDD